MTRSFLQNLYQRRLLENRTSKPLVNRGKRAKNMSYRITG